jgi:hypothetical protein
MKGENIMKTGRYLRDKGKLTVIVSALFLMMTLFLACGHGKKPDSISQINEINKPEVKPEIKKEAKAVAKKAGKDGRFIADDNGTVLDTSTNLMWAAKDNGENINWQSAKSYCENYRGGGYTDWRMPTQDELAKLYTAAKTYKSDCGYSVDLTELIRLTCAWVWASEKRGSDAANFDFYAGKQNWSHQSIDYESRALPVRSGK